MYSYSEAIEVLYSSNSFALSGLEAAHRFLFTVSPHSLDRIRILDLTSIQVPDFHTTREAPKRLPWRRLAKVQERHRVAEEEWLHICSVLRSMTRLKVLRIKIDDNSHNFLLEHLFFQPLMEIELKEADFMVEVLDRFRVGKLCRIRSISRGKMGQFHLKWSGVLNLTVVPYTATLAGGGATRGL